MEGSRVRIGVSNATQYRLVPEEIRRIEQDMEKRLQDLQARMQRHQGNAEAGAAQGAGDGRIPNDFKSVGVRSYRAMHEVLIPVGRARDFMGAVLGTRDSDKLKELFGDCELVANIREITEEIVALLKGGQHGGDVRLQNCLDACTSVEQVLISVFRLESRLLEAQARARARAREPLSQEQRLELLHEIDEGSEKGIEQAIDELFSQYDTTGEGALCGAAYDEVVDLVCCYVAQESVERAERLCSPMLAFTPLQVREHIKAWLDPNGDGTITKDEAKEGVQKAVNDIEPPEEVQRRRTTLETESSDSPGCRRDIEEVSDPMELLELIDDGDNPETAITKLFKHFDPRGEGSLAGVEREEVIRLVSEYVANESRERALRLNRPSLEMQAAQLREHVREWLDPDGDGVVTLDEAKAGLVKAVCDIDPRAEVERKKAALLAKRRATAPAGVATC